MTETKTGNSGWFLLSRLLINTGGKRNLPHVSRMFREAKNHWFLVPFDPQVVDQVDAHDVRDEESGNPPKTM